MTRLQNDKHQNLHCSHRSSPGIPSAQGTYFCCGASCLPPAHTSCGRCDCRRRREAYPSLPVLPTVPSEPPSSQHFLPTALLLTAKNMTIIVSANPRHRRRNLDALLVGMSEATCRALRTCHAIRRESPLAKMASVSLLHPRTDLPSRSKSKLQKKG